MTSLHEKKCLPCEGGQAPFTPEEVSRYLAEVNNWQSINDKKITREFVFGGFGAALEFANRVGAIAEAEDHHPDIFIHDYKKVTIILTTHAIGGLSENDFILAAKIDRLIRSSQS